MNENLGFYRTLDNISKPASLALNQCNSYSKKVKVNINLVTKYPLLSNVSPFDKFLQ